MALMTANVDHLLIAHKEKGKTYVEKLLEKFEWEAWSKEVSAAVGSKSRRTTRKYSDSASIRHWIVVVDRTSRKATDLLYRVSALQTSVRGATVSTLMDANKVVELAV